MAATINDQLRDEAISHALYVARYGNGAARKMIRLLNEADALLSAELLNVLDGVDAATWSERRLASLLASVRRLNQKAYKPVTEALKSELAAFAEHEAGYQFDLFNQLLPEAVLNHVELQAITPDQVYAAAVSRPFQGRLLSEWATKLEADRLTKITNAVRMGYLLGETTETIIRRVVGTRAANREDGAIQENRRNLAAVTRTAIAHVASTARQSFASANSDMVKGKQWLSTLDTRTTTICIVRDRLKYTLDGKPIDHNVPYLRGPGRAHFCCRSTETLILKSWRELGIDADELDAGTRASMDGQTPGDTTYSEWLQRQPYDRQKAVLGKERADLLRAGKLKVPDFFNDRGEFLTLDQLRRLEPRAFE
ncbi:hypothetical protein ACNZA9_001767 [Cronobacter sakazakii]|nr:hypothetical protein [Cronobacter sakazakii]TWR32379.1 hypothetical protein FQY86_21785 [Cronobacter sakazakii]